MAGYVHRFDNDSHWYGRLQICGIDSQRSGGLCIMRDSIRGDEHREAEAMIAILAMICGAFTSAAWVTKKPSCYVLMVLSALLFIVIKELQQ
jgi:hypothetical protein